MKYRVPHRFFTRPPDGTPLLDSSALRLEKFVLVPIPRHLRPAEGRMEDLIQHFEHGYTEKRKPNNSHRSELSTG
jgi:hypothetical protein